MHGLRTDHEFLYVVLNVFSLFEPSLGDMSPYPTPEICAHGLIPLSGGQFWEILLENSSNASDIIRILQIHVMGWDRELVIPLGSANTPWIGILDKCMPGFGTDHKFLYFSVVLNNFPRFKPCLWH